MTTAIEVHAGDVCAGDTIVGYGYVTRTERWHGAPKHVKIYVRPTDDESSGSHVFHVDAITKIVKKG